MHDQVLVSFVVSSMDEASWLSKMSGAERYVGDDHCYDGVMSLHDLEQYDDFLKDLVHELSTMAEKSKLVSR